MSTVQAIATVFLRILALYGIIRYLPGVLVYASAYFDAAEVEGGAEQAELLKAMIYWSAVVLLSVLLFVLSRPLARLISPRADQSQQSAQVRAEEIISGGTFLIGVLLVAYQLPGVLMELSQAAVARMRDLDTSYAGYLRDPWMAAERALMLLIGFWLLLRPVTLARFYSWLRTAGLPKEGAVEEGPEKGV